jgi:hypothetical protein
VSSESYDLSKFLRIFNHLKSILVYQDDSSDELTEAIDDLLLPASDTEDIWQQDEDDETSDDETSEDDDDQVEEVRLSIVPYKVM